MPRVSFTENLRRHLAVPPVDVGGATVREALDAVFAGNEQLRTYILDDQDRLRKHVTIFLNGGMIRDRARLSDVVAPDGEIFVFQALSGG
jgi:hypothetical protein